MVKKINCLLTLSILSILAHSQTPSIQWQKCYGGSNPDLFHYLTSLNENGYFLVGNTDSNDGDVTGNHNGPGDLWIVRIDSAGNLQWQKCFGGSNPEISGPLKEISNGLFAFCGGTMSNNGDVSGNHATGLLDGWFVKIDSSGNILSQKCYGGSLHDGFNDFIEVPNGFILTGGSQSNNGDVNGNHHSSLGFPDAWLLKIDFNGNIVWQKCLGGFEEDFANAILATPDGGFILGCSSNSLDGNISAPYGMFDFWIVKVDSLGDIVWDRSYGGSKNDLFFSMCASDDSGYVLVGSTESNDGLVSGNHNTNTSDTWILKIDSIGNLQWQKCYGGSNNDAGRYVVKCSKGGYLINGTSGSSDGNVTGLHDTGSGTFDMWLEMVDSLGNLQWQKCLGGYDSDQGTMCVETVDSGYFVIGASNSFDGDLSGVLNHGNDSWVVKLSPLPDPISTYSHSITDFKCYFNKVKHSATINFYSYKTENMRFNLLDVTGRILLFNNLKSISGFNKTELNMPMLAKGIYVATLVTSSGMVSKKICID